MRRSKLICATMLAFGTVAPVGSALAATGEHNNAAGVAAVLAAKVSPGQAIATAEQQTGGRAVKLDVEEEKGVHLYEIKTISEDKVLNVFVDTATGKVVRTEEEGMISGMLDHEDKANSRRSAVHRPRWQRRSPRPSSRPVAGLSRREWKTRTARSCSRRTWPRARACRK